MTDGLIPLPAPTAEALEEAAKIVLGDEIEKTLPDGTKIFKGMGRVFIQGPDEIAGDVPAAASPELQARLMAAATRIREAAEEARRDAILDPAKNPMIRIPD